MMCKTFKSFLITCQKKWVTLAARMMTIYHWELSSTSIYFKENDFTVMSLKKRQRLLSVDDADLNVERKKLE